MEILRANPTVLARRAATHDDVCTTWITAAELYYGAAKSARSAENAIVVSRFLGTLPVLGFDHAPAQIFGEAKALLERRGARLADADLLIASTAIAHAAIIVTGNRRHYARVPGVTLENWTR